MSGTNTMELTYTKVGDYLIPDLAMDNEDEAEEMPLGKYGMLRESFLKREPHLREIDRQAQEQVDKIVSGLMKRDGVNEALKASNQMAWVQAVNSFTAQAEETVLTEIVYK